MTLGEILVLVVGVAVPVILYLRSRSKTSLTVEFGPIDTPVELRPGTPLDEDLAILYKGQPVDNVFLIQGILGNTGNTSITYREIIRPISFEFATGTEFLRQPRTVEPKPDNIECDWQIEKGSNLVTLSFDLLNPGDYIDFEFVCTGPVEMPRVTSGIEELKRIGVIDRQQQREQRNKTRLIGNMITLILLAMVAGIIALQFRTDDSTIGQAVRILTVGYFSIFLVVFLWTLYRRIRPRWQ